MDGKNFDDLIRRLSTTRLTRLSTIRGLVAGVTAALTGVTLAEDESEAKNKRHKGRHAAHKDNKKHGKGGHAAQKKGKGKGKGKHKVSASGETTTTTKAPPTTTTTTKAPPTTTTTTRPPFCGHSTGPNGGCKGACTSAGFTGNQCNPICGSGQFVGACPVGQGGGNPCCNAGYCDPNNFVAGSNGNPVYVGPTSGCS